MTTWILIIMFYGGEFKSTHYATQGTCEAALITATDNGMYKHINTAECIEETKQLTNNNNLI